MSGKVNLKEPARVVALAIFLFSIFVFLLTSGCGREVQEFTPVPIEASPNLTGAGRSDEVIIPQDIPLDQYTNDTIVANILYYKQIPLRWDTIINVLTDEVGIVITTTGPFEYFETFFQFIKEGEGFIPIEDERVVFWYPTYTIIKKD